MPASLRWAAVIGVGAPVKGSAPLAASASPLALIPALLAGFALFALRRTDAQIAAALKTGEG